MKKLLLFLLISFQFAAIGQVLKEVVQPLSDKAVKGYLYDVSKDAQGNLNATYKFKVNKKSDEVSYEEYSFSPDLKFMGTKEAHEKKEQHDDFERTSLLASVGGSNSFDVLSMKLKMTKVVSILTWNHEKQQWSVKKVISRETVKAKNDQGKVYYGYASYSSSDDKKSDLFVIGKVESKDKNQNDKFYVLLMNDQLNLIEKEIDLKESCSLVFCDQLKNDHVIMVFAPMKGAADISKYKYFEYDISGNLVNQTEFTSPASALLITASAEDNGSVYFFGTSTKYPDPFERVFSEYAPIFNPGFTQANNKLDMKWAKSAEQKMENFHLLKLSGSKLMFSSTTPVSEFKSKFVTAPGDKGATPYNGSKFSIEQFSVTPAGDYLIAGQLSGSVNLGLGNPQKTYEDIVCFHLDANGKLKAQYGIGKVNNDKKSEIFSMLQHFYPSADGMKIYWELFEVKGVKGYESFLDAYEGNATFYPLFFPRMVTIDLSSTKLGAVQALGQNKYFLRRDFISLYDKDEKSISYLGHDEDFKKLWIGKILIP